MRTAPGVDEIDRVCGPAEHVAGGLGVGRLAVDVLSGNSHRTEAESADSQLAANVEGVLEGIRIRG